MMRLMLGKGGGTKPEESRIQIADKSKSHNIYYGTFLSVTPQKPKSD